MSDFLGARISLISKSDIRYSGVLHEINSEESTVSLENVISYGTEGRRGKPDEEIPPADQIYEYIVFRGSDVKDLRIEEGPGPKENKPPAVPNDPAILGARPRQANNNNAPPSFQQGPPQGPLQGLPQGMPQGGPGFIPNMNMVPPGAWGPGGPTSRNFQYPPPPGWYPPQGPGAFGPGGPGPWNNYYQPGPQFGPGAPGGPGPSNNGRPSQQQQSQPQQSQQQPQQQQQAPPQAAEQKPTPIGAAAEKQFGTMSSPAELEPKSLGQASVQAAAKNNSVPTGPRGATTDANKASPSTAAPKNGTAGPGPALPTGPKNATRITPIVPLPAGLVNKTVAQTASATAKQGGDGSAASALRDATQAAKAAVAVAMAKLEGGSTAGPPAAVQQDGAQGHNGSTAMDNLTRKVNEMRVNAVRSGGQNQARGRGRGGGGGRAAKVEVPADDFDFALSNAKFNKADVGKEHTGDATVSDADGREETPELAADGADEAAPPAYNKTKSFFDNISSEAKDRAENGGQKAGGREWRGEEQRRNIETFGQGSVDGGYRGYRGRGRGRGRGGYGRGRGGYNRRQHNDQQGVAQQ